MAAGMKPVAILFSLVVVAASPSLASAQPAAPCAPCYLTPPGEVAPPSQGIEITAEEAWLLKRRDINKSRYVVGGIVESAYGFGIGHIVQGRWLEKGWVFTLGEVSAVAVAVYGFRELHRSAWCRTGEFGTECGDRTYAHTLMLSGLVTYMGFRIWGAIDAWATPMAEAGRRRTLRKRLGLPPGAYLAPVLSTTPDATGPMAGFDLRF